MLSDIKSYLKFFYKVRLIGAARSFLLFFAAIPVQEEGWDDRILIINIEGMGDLVVMTSVLKHYKTAFPGKKIFLLVRKGVGVDEPLFGKFADTILYLDDKIYKKDPRYGVKLINMLRAIGFRMVVNHDPSVAEILGKELAIHLGAEEVIGYEGFGIQLSIPFDINMEKGIAYVKKSVFPRYTKVIPGIDVHADLTKRLTNVIHHYLAIYDAVTHAPPPDDVSTELSIPEDVERSVLARLKELGVAPESYCALVLGKSAPQYEWPPERFAEALLTIKEKKIPVVIAGLPREAKLRDAFAVRYGNDFVDLIGKLSVSELTVLIKYSLFAMSNDTGPTHIAVALKKPSISILGLGHFGMISFYGHRDINHWVYSKTAPCLCDDWRCIYSIKGEEPMPCILGIPVEAVASQLRDMLAYMEQHPGYPHTPFEAEFKNV